MGCISCKQTVTDPQVESRSRTSSNEYSQQPVSTFSNPLFIDSIYIWVPTVVFIDY